VCLEYLFHFLKKQTYKNRKYLYQKKLTTLTKTKACIKKVRISLET